MNEWSNNWRVSTCIYKNGITRYGPLEPASGPNLHASERSLKYGLHRPVEGGGAPWSSDTQGPGSRCSFLPISQHEFLTGDLLCQRAQGFEAFRHIFPSCFLGKMYKLTVLQGCVLFLHILQMSAGNSSQVHPLTPAPFRVPSHLDCRTDSTPRGSPSTQVPHSCLPMVLSISSSILSPGGVFWGTGVCACGCPGGPGSWASGPAGTERAPNRCVREMKVDRSDETASRKTKGRLSAAHPWRQRPGCHRAY